MTSTQNLRGITGTFLISYKKIFGKESSDHTIPIHENDIVNLKDEAEIIDFCRSEIGNKHLNNSGISISDSRIFKTFFEITNIEELENWIREKRR